MNKLVFLLITIGFSFNLAAQEPIKEKDHEMNTRGKEKIKALYIAFITQELNLNEEESEKFWPVHNQYDIEIKETHRKNINELDKEESVLAIKKKFVPKFSKIIGIERTYLFYKKDKEFRDKLIDRVRDRRLKKNGEGNNKPDRERNHP
jgi:hypothetical protein